MSKSYWLRIVAIGGCLAAGIAYAQPISNYGGSQPRATQEKTPPPKQEQSPPSFQENIRRIAEAIEAINTRQNSAEESEHTARDLQAQEKMAFWAMAMFFAALAQLVAACVTLYYLYATFKEARRTAEAGISAARTAERTLYEHDRAWIFRDIVSVKWRNRPNVPTNDWVVSIKWINVGRTPAILEKLEYKIVDKDLLQDAPDYSNASLLPIIDALPVGKDFTTQEVGLSNPQTKNGVPIEYVFYGRLFYKEMSGIERVSGFALSMGTHFSVCGSYNSNEYNYYK